jgi:hypothetical protein
MAIAIDVGVDRNVGSNKNDLRRIEWIILTKLKLKAELFTSVQSA